MPSDPVFPKANDDRLAGTLYRVITDDNPWGLTMGSILVEVRRGEFWDYFPGRGDCWVVLRPVAIDAEDTSADRALMLEIFERETRYWAVPWLEVSEAADDPPKVADRG